MRRIPVALLLAVAAALAVAGASLRGIPREGPRTFRVATFNIHKGADRRGPYDLERTIAAIDSLGADLVGVQEAMRNDPAFDCDDQPRLIAEGLRRRTGRRWTHVYAKAWITEDRQCAQRGRGDDVATEGLAFLASERLIMSGSVRLNEGRVGLAVRLAPIADVTFVVTHLAANRQNQPDRIREIAALLPWAARHGPGVLMGDFNAEPGAPELHPVMVHYRDAWAEAAARGQVGGVATGSTRPNRVSRIDYVLYAPRVNLTLESVDVVDTAMLGLGEVSDHLPVVATFRRTADPVR